MTLPPYEYAVEMHHCIIVRCPASNFLFLTNFSLFFSQICISSHFHFAISLISCFCRCPRPTATSSFRRVSILHSSLIFLLIWTLHPVSIACASHLSLRDAFVAFITVAMNFASFLSTFSASASFRINLLVISWVILPWRNSPHPILCFSFSPRFDVPYYDTSCCWQSSYLCHCK